VSCNNFIVRFTQNLNFTRKDKSETFNIIIIKIYYA